jgi:acetyl esterase/lipase
MLIFELEEGLQPVAGPIVPAMVALNPVVDLLAYSPQEQQNLADEVARVALGRLIEISPIEFVRPGNPPTLIQHGTRDEIGSIDTMRRFRDVMVQAGNDCVLIEYQGAEHAFHYFPEYLDTVTTRPPNSSSTGSRRANLIQW